MYDRKPTIETWTMAHGHFLGMGGFTLVNDRNHQLEEPEQPGLMSVSADWDPYAEYVRQREWCQRGPPLNDSKNWLVPTIVFPAITSAQIQDRSKGDGLSKLITILQASWFVVQCTARGFQGLALTQERDNVRILVEQAFGCGSSTPI
jgi:hypothetical protein